MARVPRSERTRNELKEMFAGTGGADRSGLMRQAARLIVEEALEAEAEDALGRGYYEHGAVGARLPQWLSDGQGEERRGRDRVRGAAGERYGGAVSLARFAR